MMQRIPPISLLASRLDAVRAARVEHVLATHDEARRKCTAATAALWAGPAPGAVAVLDDAASEVLAALRAPDERDPFVARAAARLDALVRTRSVELLDTRWVPSVARRISYTMLDGFNRRSGAYARWGELLVDALDGGVRVYELAAGNGGFARWLAAHPPAGRTLSLVSSDLDESNVARGLELARRWRADVRFEVRDALDLRPLAGHVDIFVCTQAFHHLPPGVVVGVIAAAVRAAPRGILVIDLVRSAANAFAAPAFVGALAPWPIVVVDGVISVLRAYAPAELLALARLAGATHARTEAVGPAHVALRVWSDA